VVIPTTSPYSLSRGPPLLPGESGTVIWIILFARRNGQR